MEPTSNKSFRLVFIAGIALLFLIVIVAVLIPLVNSNPQRGVIKDHPTVLVYLPDGFDPQKTYPLVFALSPVGDARAGMNVWMRARAAEKYDWIVASSKEFRNGVSMAIVMAQVANELDFVEQNYPVDGGRVIMSGLSGGGMGSYAFASFYPNRVAALVINTGVIHEYSKTGDYPLGKQAVLLASPADPLYQQMNDDRAFLESRDWSVLWMEFGGGHTYAPAEIYEKAAEWLMNEQQ